MIPAQLHAITQHLLDHIDSEDFHNKARLNETAFTRQRRLPLKNLVLTLLSNMTSSVAHELFQCSNGNELPVSTAAFCKQRGLFNPEALVDLNRVLVEQVPIQRRNGLRWLAIDGTTLSLPKHPSVQDVFGMNKSSHRPQARLSQLLDLTNKLTLDVQVDALAVGERTLARRHAYACCPGDLILKDRGYNGVSEYQFWYDQGVDFCIRVPISQSHPYYQFYRSGETPAMAYKV